MNRWGLKYFFVFWASCALYASPAQERYLFKYNFRVAFPEKSTRFRLWVPYPRENKIQSVEDSHIVIPFEWKLNREKKFGNRMIFFEGETKGGGFEATLTFLIRRESDRGGVVNSTISKSVEHPSLYLDQEKNTPFLPVFREIANKETWHKKTDSDQIRALYQYIVRTMKYDKSGSGWGKGDAAWACTSKRGNCTDFHSLFIGLSRVIGIPARFFIGFPIPGEKEFGEISGYHCWAQAYSKSQGWIPIDASEAKKTGKLDDYYGILSPDRIEFSMGRDISLNPVQLGESLNFFVYPYLEVDGKALEITDRKFSFKRVKESQKKLSSRL